MAEATLVVMALEIESQGRFEAHGVPVLFTGLGKVNAAMVLARRLAEGRGDARAPSRVINFGTAGSPHFPAGSIVECDRFVQRDMDVRPLGYAYGVTPFDVAPTMLETSPMFTSLPRALCGSGDSFATGESVMHCDVVDMEAYAYAKVCRAEGVQFGCVKYVTDGADSAAASDWRANLVAAADAFIALYLTLR